jgi:solute:Na+ symporter, SSS family
MAGFEWAMVTGFVGIIIFFGIWSQKYVKNAADYLVAGRGCGKYLGATAGEAASMGAISLIAFLQAAYVGGPVAWWTMIVTVVVYLLISVTGWGIYRLRETRAMTLNELLEKRYSRRLRIFCGVLCFISGVLNMGIFPIVTGRFIVYICNLPVYFEFAGLTFKTVWLTTGILVAVSLLLAFKGGQISLIITDFMQWSLIMAMYIAVGIAVYRIVNWDDISAAILAQKDTRPMLDPYMPTTANAFGLWYFVLFSFRAFYNVLSWAPGSGRAQSATQAREAKMMWILSYIRQGANMGLVFAAVACFAFMNSPQFADMAAKIQATIQNIPNAKVQSEMAVPIFLSYILPVGVKGLFVAGMVAASISTLDTYFLSWGGVLTQDVIAPLKRKPLSNESRLKFLRWSVAGVAVFVYFFSLVWKQSDYIWMYFAITGSIYTGGAGAVILGGIYWRRATEKGAWAAMITGSGLAIISIIVQQQCSREPWWPHWLNGLWLSVMASLCAIMIFVIISFLTYKQPYDLEELLNRKPHLWEKHPDKVKYTWFEILITVITIVLLVSLAIGGWYSRTHEISAQSWLTFWKWYSFIVFGYSIPVAIWFFIGSLFDLRTLFKTLKENHLLATTDSDKG